MTTLNEILNGPTTVAFSGYNVGSFDCRQSTGGYVDLTLTSATDGTTPANNRSTVYGSPVGLTVHFEAITPPPSPPAEDGSCTELRYYDGINPDTFKYTGHTTLLVDSEASVNIGQLQGGHNVPFSALAHQAPTLTPGQQVAAAGGTYVRLKPGTVGSAYIEASIQGLTWVENFSFDGKSTLIVDLTSATAAYHLIDVIVSWQGGSVQAVLVSMYAANLKSYFPCCMLAGYTVAQVQSHVSRNGAYVTFQ